MDKHTAFEKVKSILEDVFEGQNVEIQESTKAEDIELWDSLAHITILESVMEEFQISFSLDEMLELDGVEKIVNAVVKKSEG